MKSCLWPIPLALALALPQNTALAASGDSTLLLLPWSGTALQFVDDSARFSGAFSSNLGRGLWTSAKMSVPLTQSGDQSSVLDDFGGFTGFTAHVSLGYDSTYQLISLVEGEDFAARNRFCQKHKLSPCSDSKILKKLEAIEKSQNNYHNIRPSAEIGRHHSVGIDLALAYDGYNALQNRSSTITTLHHDYELDASFNFTLFWEKVILQLRPGLSLDKTIDVEEIEICTEEMVDGNPAQICADYQALTLEGEPQLSGHLKTAITLWDTSSRLSSDLAPGLEFRANFDQLGQDYPLINLRFTGFLGPKAWPLGLRSGLGLGVTLSPLSPTEALQDITPFAFVGATFDTLQ